MFFKDNTHRKKGIILYDKGEEEVNRKNGWLPIYADSPPTKFDMVYSLYMNNYFTKRNDVDGTYLSDLNVLQNYLQKHLKVGGSAVFVPNQYTHEGQSFPFLLKLFFKHVIVHYSDQMIAIGYNGAAYTFKDFPYLDADSDAPRCGNMCEIFKYKLEIFATNCGTEKFRSIQKNENR